MGGQGLRGRDGTQGQPPTVLNCCVWCLHRGVKAVENLYHVVFECGEYATVRVGVGVPQLLDRGGTDIFLVHRGRWSWNELKLILRLFSDISEARGIGGHSSRKAVKLQEVAELCWFD